MPDTFPRDRFDDIPDDLERVGAHRAPRKRGRGWLWVAWCALAALILIAAGVFGLFLINGTLNFKNPFPSGTSTATPTATPTPTPTVVPTVAPDLQITVLNGTTIEGAAGDVSATLEEAGWKEVSTANADETDIQKTVVYYSDPANEAAALGVSQSLPGSTIAQTQVYANSGAAVTVVIGADYQSPAQ